MAEKDCKAVGGVHRIESVLFYQMKGNVLFKEFVQKFRHLFKVLSEKRTSSKKVLDSPQSKSPRSGRPKAQGPGPAEKPKPTGRLGSEGERVAWDISQFEVSPVEGKSRFHDLDLPADIMHAIHDLGFQYCTPIQAEILPMALTGSDTTGKAQTGTGKSAAFLINIYTQMMRRPLNGKRRPGAPRALILAPTRELVLQIEKDARDIGKYTPVNIQSVFGGLGYDKQRRALENKLIDVVVATPGRLLDFQRKRLIRLDKVEILVIDEADRMLDMGFIPDVRKIVYSTPPKSDRQTMFFSATITTEVERLAEQWTRRPLHVEIDPEHVAAESVNQLVYIVTTEEKFTLLVNLILSKMMERVLVFTNRKDQTFRLSDRLKQYRINCAVLNGDVPQNKRIKILESFRSGKTRVLVATDVAARGLHIEGISHVINYTLPRDAEDYVHRIGRTGRAGAAGTSISFACEEDSFYIPPIEEFLGESLSCIQPEESLLELPPLPPPDKEQDRTAAASRQGQRKGSNARARSGARRRRKPRSRASGGRNVQDIAG